MDSVGFLDHPPSGRTLSNLEYGHPAAAVALTSGLQWWKNSPLEI